MERRDFTDEEKEFIREYAQEGIERNESNEQMKGRGDDLHRMFGGTRAQISGIMAHKLREDGSLILQDREEYAKNIRRQLENVLSIDWTEVDIDETLESINEGFNYLELDEDIIEDEDDVVTLRSYEHINYDNETKEKWRLEWRRFIGENTDQQKRKNMRVLCLPAKGCHEIKHYLELGFQPQNITGVIKGEDVDATNEFLKNATQIGLNTHVGDLEKYLESQEDRFDVVVLDFHSGVSPKHSRILKKLCLNETAIVITNFAARRELENIQRLFDVGHFHKLRKKEKITPGMSYMEIFEKDLEEREDERTLKFPVSSSREAGLHYLMRRVGILREENWLFTKEEMEEFVKNVSPVISEQEINETKTEHVMYDGTDINRYIYRNILSGYAAEAGRDLEKILINCGSSDSAMWAHMSTMMLEHAAFGEPLLIKNEQWDYKSPTGKTKFVSNFVKVFTPLKKYKNMLPSIKILLEIGKLHMIDPKERGTKHGHTWISDKKGKALDIPSFNLSHYLNIENHAGIQSRISFRKLISDIRLFWHQLDLTEPYYDSLKKGSRKIS